jgi:hypothetical protein
MRGGSDHDAAGIKSYYVMGITWGILGVITGIVSHHALGRILFIAFSFVIYLGIWEKIRCYGRQHSRDERDWTKIHIKMVAKSKPLFYVWFGVLIQQLMWFKCDLVSLEHRYIVCGWIQGGMILFCSLCSFFPWLTEGYSTRKTLRSVRHLDLSSLSCPDLFFFSSLVDEESDRRTKKVMIGLIVLFPPWRTPWFEENTIILQLRWVIMLLLFGLQCVEALFFVHGPNDHLNEIFFLRIGWIPTVQPALLIFSVVPVSYFFYVMLKIFANVHMRDPFHSQSKALIDPENVPNDNYDYRAENPYDSPYRHDIAYESPYRQDKNYESIYHQEYGEQCERPVRFFFLFYLSFHMHRSVSRVIFAVKSSSLTTRTIFPLRPSRSLFSQNIGSEYEPDRFRSVGRIRQKNIRDSDRIPSLTSSLRHATFFFSPHVKWFISLARISLFLSHLSVHHLSATTIPRLSRDSQDDVTPERNEKGIRRDAGRKNESDNRSISSVLSCEERWRTDSLLRWIW